LLTPIESGSLFHVMGSRSIQRRYRDERRNLLVGASSSLLTHLLAFGLWISGGAAFLAMHRTAFDPLKDRQQAANRTNPEPPTIFVEVTPEQATPDAAPDSKFYGVANARAANPDPTVDTQQPKIEGTQDKVPKTFDTLRPQPEVQPEPPSQPDPEPEPKPEPAPKPPDPGELAVSQEDPKKPAEPPKKPRPRTLVEARVQQGIIAGPKMRQDGGVRRRGAVSFDVRATPFGAYDAAVIAAIQQRWYDLLEESAIAPRSGKVVVEFTMHYDGRVTDVRVVEQEVGEILALYCRKAISEPAPYAPWPSDLRRMIGKDYREVRVTFYYL
jgi:outer membrane biosynthesis protein TonB